MDDRKIETTQGLCVVALTKHLMKILSIPQDEAYAKLMEMELFSLLMDSETRLFLEPNRYLIHACDVELKYGRDQLYDFINEG